LGQRPPGGTGAAAGERVARADRGRLPGGVETAGAGVRPTRTARSSTARSTRASAAATLGLGIAAQDMAIAGIQAVVNDQVRVRNWTHVPPLDACTKPEMRTL